MAEATDFSYPFLTVSIVLGTNRIDFNADKHILFLNLIISQATGRLFHLKFKKESEFPQMTSFLLQDQCANNLVEHHHLVDTPTDNLA